MILYFLRIGSGLAGRVLIAAALIAAVLGPAGPLAAQIPPDETAPSVLITGLAYYGNEGSADEAVALSNPTDQSATLDERWSLTDAAGHRLVFPASGLVLEPHATAWLANSPDAFARQFGRTPEWTYSQLTGATLSFANDSGSIRLERRAGVILDEVNPQAGAWPAGSAAPAYASMERIPGDSAADAWRTAPTNTLGLTDSAGNLLSGSPGAPNAGGQLAIGGRVLINEVAWAGTRASSSAEWVEIFNGLTSTLALTGWRLGIGDVAGVALAGAVEPGGFFVVARAAGVFGASAKPDQVASFTLSNSGARLQLFDDRIQTVDALAYGQTAAISGWAGRPVQPYVVPRIITAQGQVLTRRVNSTSAWVDSDRAGDWWNDTGDPQLTRRPVYEGWDGAAFDQQVTASAWVTVAVAPDASYGLAAAAFSTAHRSIDIESFTFDHAGLAGLLVHRVGQGVRVRLLLDGAPVGGLIDQERWVCQQLLQAGNGSGCWFMRSDPANKVRARYAYLHAKIVVVDGPDGDSASLLVSSENFSPRGMPDDDKADGTLGHRGALAMTDAPALIAAAQALFERDIAPAFRDIAAGCASSASCGPYGPPAAGFQPSIDSGGISYTARFTGAVRAWATLTLNTSPESHLAVQGAILPLLDQAGGGDEIWFEQLDEPAQWGAGSGNPRIEGALAAARRGARVRVVLDGAYDPYDTADIASNAHTARLLNAIAITDHLDLRATVGDPTWGGIHNKMILARVGGQGYAQIGSWNGTETSAKLNREVSLLIESDEVFDYLRRVAASDEAWSRPTHLPVVLRDYSLQRLGHLVVSEVMVNPVGGDETGREWIELYNPTVSSVSLANLWLGDGAPGNTRSSDAWYRFPPTATLAPGATLLVAENAVAFQKDWGRWPDYELADYAPLVPELNRGEGDVFGSALNLKNDGDEVMLGQNSTLIDVVSWGSSELTATRPFTGIIPGGSTLQRWPVDSDTNDCRIDFRLQSIPSPGLAP